MPHATTRRPAVRVSIEPGGSAGRAGRVETLATEEPLQILVNGAPYATTMRTPGHDLELALGFLLSESVVVGGEDVAGAAHCPGSNPGPDSDHNTVTVDLRAHVPEPEPARHRHVTSACGVCGTSTVDALRARGRHHLGASPASVAAATLATLPDRMRSAQRVFDRTGGLHAAALFALDGRLLCLREDVGRHNAVDKVVGWALTRDMLPLAGHVLQVSGRASFELVQKCWLAGCPVLAAVSAPSSLAADLAEEVGLTLVGFSRGDRFTVYTGVQRITGITPEPASTPTPATAMPGPG